MGGEKCIESGEDVLVSGSPPHGRGKDVPFIGTLAVPGITPAWAGKSRRYSIKSGRIKGSPPHGRGKAAQGGGEWSGDGSPPHGRGKGVYVTNTAISRGITPAWAGKRCVRHEHSYQQGDHPRMGGEKLDFLHRCPRQAGSPPHGRGKGFTKSFEEHGFRITPAWAGKSVFDVVINALLKDHPRMGGEKCVSFLAVNFVHGSPPHGRGKVDSAKTDETIDGITPAWAGKRLKRSHRSGIFISGPIPFHSVLHRPAGSGGSRAGRDGSPAGQPQNAGPA